MRDHVEIVCTGQDFENPEIDAAGGDGAGGAARRVGVLGAQEDRDLDLVVPVVLHDVDLVAHEERAAEYQDEYVMRPDETLADLDRKSVV